MRAIRGDPAPRAVPDRGRRPARRDRRRRRRRRAVPADRRDPRGHPRGGRPRGPASRSGLDEAPTRMAIVAMGRYGGFELSYGSDADVMFVHDPVAGRRPARGGDVRPGGRQRAAPPARPARRRPGAGGRRRPAARGQAGAAGAHDRLLRRLLREVVEGLGGAGAAAGRRGRGRRGPAATVHRADRPAALPGRRASAATTSSRSAGSRRGSTTSGCRAAPTPTPTSSWVAAGSPTSSGPSSCCRCSTPASMPALRTPRTLDALGRRRRGGPARRSRTPSGWPTAGAP